MGRLFRQLTERDRVLMSHFKKQGCSISEIARKIGKNKSSISRELKRNATHTSFEDKVFWYSVRHLLSGEELKEHLKTLSPNDIEEFQPTTQWTAREAQRNRDYRLCIGNQVRRRKKLETRKWVVERLKSRWSPEQIAGRSKIDGPEPVSHEYVYLLVKQDRKRGGQTPQASKALQETKTAL